MNWIKLLCYIGCIELASCGSFKDGSAASEDLNPVTEEPAFNDRGDLRFVFYNVENLFDTFDDTTTIDDEFLPYGIKGWNRERYQDKLRKIFKVLVNTGGWELPDIIGLCEIENRLVLRDLIHKTPLSRERYGIIHEDSPDARGIDLGFLYRKDKFKPLSHRAIRIDFPFDPVKTRDILEVDGLVNQSDTLHIFVCHFPSRRGGQKASEPKRMYVAGQVRSRLDSILEMVPDARIIVVGDFNDEPTDKSILEGLSAVGGRDAMNHSDLYNFMYAFKVEDGLGSYKYRGQWNMLDQFMVSRGLLKSDGSIYVKGNSARIFKKDWLMQEDPEAPGKKPFRTYGGAHYYGGYSDHLPIYLDIFFN